METLNSDAIRPKPVQTGIDALVSDDFAPLRGLRMGLVTNLTGGTGDGTSTIDTLFHAPRVHLKALFGPEHGIRGTFDQPHVDDTVDSATGLPVYSLYGTRTAPSAAQMDGLEALVYDIQDIGTRFYTYISTLLHVMRAASDAELSVFVLDRPNPITGTHAEGPLPDKLSFTACHPLPVRHGLTVGETAKLMHAECGLTCPLTVIPCRDWRRRDWFDSTQMLWVNPSPSMRSLTQALLYPGVGLLEFTNVSVGRGTDTPFEVFGAPWIDGRALAGFINDAGIPGLRALGLKFMPRTSVHSGVQCAGVNFIVTDRDAFDAVRLGITLAVGLRALYPSNWQAEKFITLLANQQAFDGVLSGQSYAQIAAAWEDSLAAFKQRASAHLLYA